MEIGLFFITVISNARTIHRMELPRVVFWAGEDPDVLNRTYNLAQVRLAEAAWPSGLGRWV